MKGIKWHLINHWTGHGFTSHTFAASLPNGALIKTTERTKDAKAPDHLEHVTTALTFVPELEVDPADSGEFAALELSPRPLKMELDPRFYRPPRIELDPELDPEHLEPQGPNVWAPLAAVRAFAKAIKARL